MFKMSRATKRNWSFSNYKVATLLKTVIQLVRGLLHPIVTQHKQNKLNFRQQKNSIDV